MTAIHIDLETRSAVDLRKSGVHVYAEDPSTDVLCACYATGDSNVALWRPGDAVPAAISLAVILGTPIIAHNAAFERALWKHVLAPRYGWPMPQPEQWRCTMTMALSLALPPSLGECAKAIGLEEQKDGDGRDLMMRMARPRKARKGEDPNVLHWFEDDERKQQLYAYCKQDVEVERALESRLLALRPDELALWHLDQEINDRGLYVDRALCNSALQIVDTAAKWLDDEIKELTDGAVTHTTKVADILAWLHGQGVHTDNLDKGAVDELLSRDDLSDVVRRVVEIRKEAAKAAVKKIAALLAGTSADSRARGLLQFHAASTGRWGGRRFQPQNIARPRDIDVDGELDAIATGSADFVRLVYGEPLAAVSDCLRGLVGAAPGNTLYAADFSNIEGRLIAWLAGEEWKLQAFRDYDAGRGPDIYKLAYAKSFGIAPEAVDKPQRQIGKVMELALGYQGGVGAFQKMAVGYGVHVEDERADELKEMWREAHPNVVQFWYDLENAAVEAIRNRGVAQHVGRIAFKVAGSFMFMRLPSGRAIAYPYPCIKKKLMPWTKQGELLLPGRWASTTGGPQLDTFIEPVYEQLPVWKDSVCYKGIDTFTRKWSDQFAHGGLLANNAVQGTARDIESEAMTRVENAGYPVVLSVHDEVVSETPKDFGSVAEFEALMTELPAWADGLPLAAGAWSATRYRK